MDEFTPSETFLIEDIDTVKVMADPLRIQIMELLLTGPLTVKQVGDRLGLAASKLYYHINMLEKHGLIVMVETRMVANLQEKYYRAVAKNVQVANSLLTFSPEGSNDSITTIIASTLDTTRDDLLRSLQARQFELQHGAEEKARPTVITRLNFRISDAQSQSFVDRLKEVMKEFEEADGSETAVPIQNWALTIAFYPSIYFPEDEQP